MEAEKIDTVDGRLMESKSLSHSVVGLNQVISAITSRARVIPYRESCVTRILQEALGEIRSLDS